MNYSKTKYIKCFFPPLNHIKAGFEALLKKLVWSSKSIRFHGSLFHSWVVPSPQGSRPVRKIWERPDQDPILSYRKPVIVQATQVRWNHLLLLSHTTHIHGVTHTKDLGDLVHRSRLCHPWKPSTSQSLGISSHSLALWSSQPLFPWSTSLPPTFSNDVVSIGSDRIFSNLKEKH